MTTPTNPPVRPSEAQLLEWRRLSEAATPGPWEQNEVEDVPDPGMEAPKWREVGQTTEGDWVADLGIDQQADAEFIAASRTAVPALLDEVARLTGEVERLREARSLPVGPHELTWKVLSPEGEELEVGEVYTRWGYGETPPYVAIVLAAEVSESEAKGE